MATNRPGGVHARARTGLSGWRCVAPVVIVSASPHNSHRAPSLARKSFGATSGGLAAAVDAKSSSKAAAGAVGHPGDVPSAVRVSTFGAGSELAAIQRGSGGQHGACGQRDGHKIRHWSRIARSKHVWRSVGGTLVVRDDEETHGWVERLFMCRRILHM